jgi:hypothetical protein
LGASLVIDDNRVHIRKARLTIKVDQDGTGFLERAQEIRIRSGRTIDDAGHFPVEQKSESGFLFGAIFVGIADQDSVPVGPGFVFDRFDDGSAEKIPDIGDDDANRSGLLGSERTSGPIRCVTMSMDNGKDPLACAWSNVFWSAESSRNRGDTEIELFGKIVKSHDKGRYGEGDKREA